MSASGRYVARDTEGGACGALRQCRLFATAEESELRSLGGCAQRRSYGCGEVIAGPDEPPDGALVFWRGDARLVQLSADGDIVALAEFGPGDVFGLGTLAPPERSARTLEATTAEVVLYRIPSEAMRAFLLRNPRVALMALELLGSYVAAVSQRYAELALCDVRTRLARELARRSSRNPEGWIGATQEELASWIASKPGEVARGVRALREEGLIASKVHCRGITVLDEQRLAEYE